nr:hypothetical protein [Cressdnaviricota sp.]UOF78318.1 hypothetical protein [Cressdnaviricota sp.]
MEKFLIKPKECESVSPPNMDSHRHSQFTVGHIDDTNIDKLYDYLKVRFTHVLVSEEVSKTQKQHLHFIFNGEIKRNNAGTQFRDAFKEFFSLGEKTKRTFSFSPPRDYDKALAYTVKDGIYKYQGFSESEIKKAEKLSYKKYNKETFAKEYDKILGRALTGELSLREFASSYIDLKHAYRQFNINKYRLKELIENVHMKCNSDYKNSYIDDLLPYGM